MPPLWLSTSAVPRDWAKKSEWYDRCVNTFDHFTLGHFPNRDFKFVDVLRLPPATIDTVAIYKACDEQRRFNVFHFFRVYACTLFAYPFF